MNNYLWLHALLVNAIYTTAQTNTYIEDYCWRDYEGVLPSDALVGGLDRNGRSIYIGQALFEEKLIPGKIYQNDNKIYFEWRGKEYTPNQNVRILCSQQPQKFEWLRTQNSEVVRLTNKLLVKGGFEAGYSTYIGRTLTDGETSVAKVICGADDCLGLITTNGGTIRAHSTFEILTYNPEIKTIDVVCNPPIDFRIGVQSN